MTRLVLVVLCLAAVPAAAETNPFAWGRHQGTARTLSDVLVWSSVGLRTVDSWRAPDRGRAFRCQALEQGLATGLNLATKALVRRDRPDHSNDRSFFSGHSTNAMVNAGWRWSVGVPLAFGAGYLRMAADRHYPTDVATGLAVGFLAGRVCR